MAFLAAKINAPKRSKSRSKGLDPAIADALDLSQESPPDRRLELEARLLTVEPIEAVAQKCFLTTETVEAFEALFFDVRPYLEATDWIAARVIGPGLYVGFAREDEGQVWKYIAWNGGALALDVVLAVMRDRRLPDFVLAGFEDNPVYEERRLRLMVKLTIAGLQARSDEELRAMTALYEKAAALDRDSIGTTRCLEGGLQLAHSLLGLARTPKKKSLRERVLANLAKKKTVSTIRTKVRRARSRV